MEKASERPSASTLKMSGLKRTTFALRATQTTSNIQKNKNVFEKTNLKMAECRG